MKKSKIPLLFTALFLTANLFLFWGGASSCGGGSATSTSSGSSGGTGSTGGSVATSATTTSTVSITGSARYDIGSPTLTELYLSPSGDDTNSGMSSSSPLKTLNAIGPKIRSLEGVSGADDIVTLASTGYRIHLASGTYPDESRGHIMDFVQGTAQFPIIIQSTSGTRTDVTVQNDLQFDGVKYVYLRNFTISRAGDVLQFAHSDHILVSNMILNGGNYTAAGGDQSEDTVAHDMFKVNQAQYVYFEDSEARGANDNAVDWVAVQTGRMVGNVIHNTHDWCAYVKGGSSYIVIEDNEIYDCYIGGFTAGQGVGFEYMIAPWITYDTMDVKIVNNLVHDVHGAGLGVAGGYNILLAYNTLYNVGDDAVDARRTQAFDLHHGDRTCDGDDDSSLAGRCDGYLAAGGWGQPFVSGVQSDFQHVPSKNVFIFNNIVYNPSARHTVDVIFNVDASDTSMASNSNIPSPSLVDDNLIIRGNYVSALSTSGSAPLLFPPDADGCSDSNTTCTSALVTANNTINSTVPSFQSTDSSSANFLKPTTLGNIFSVPTYAIPDFTWTSLPTLTSPVPEAYRIVPTGTLSNTVSVDRLGATRSGSSVAGAFATGS